MATAGRPSKEDSVHKWRLRHPEGRIADCCRDLGISRDTARSHWATEGIVDDMRPCAVRVHEWMDNHPNGRMCDCVRDLKISRRSVCYAWKEYQPAPLVDEKGQYLLF